ncbi:MAG: class I SAM-dependent methyltransferase [Acidimicrobiales bacterium]
MTTRPDDDGDRGARRDLRGPPDPRRLPRTSTISTRCSSPRSSTGSCGSSTSATSRSTGRAAPGPRLPACSPTPTPPACCSPWQATPAARPRRARGRLRAGGNLGLLLEHAGIARAIGTDLAYSSMAFCKTAYDGEPASFFQADAECIPLADRCVDAVVNIESSGCYPDMERFYRDVARVLRPSGVFLYADLMEADLPRPRPRRAARPGARGDLRARHHRQRETSRASRAERQLLAFEEGGRSFLDREWVGADGSQLNDKLTGEDGVYHLFRCRRTDASCPPSGCCPTTNDVASGTACAQGRRDPQLHVLELVIQPVRRHP